MKKNKKIFATYYANMLLLRLFIIVKSEKKAIIITNDFILENIDNTSKM